MSQTEDAAAALLKKALIELRALRKQVRALKRAAHEPIAVIGTACRFPGDCDTPEAYWDLLRQGRSGICEVPRDRFDIDAYYDPDPDAAGKMYTRYGGYLKNIEGFDARFFGISAREAAVMDPQQRIVLEVTWEAIERAGINPQTLYGSNTGVFLGIGNWEHAVLRFGMEGPSRIGPYSATGSVGSVAAGRIAYLLGLTGPNFPVDTACSSSLLSVHLACDSLRRGDCDLALAGGTHLLLLPGLTVCFCRARMLARDGRCKTFDAAADGYVRSEGCGMVVLKRLSEAEADGDRIYAVIRGSATNQDGNSGGLTVPSGPAQEEVIRRALAAAELDPDQVSYIEAHGTGTKLGDPVEMRALGNVFNTGTRAQPLVVGSLKTNLGHLESSAGIASLLKTILMVQHQAIPPHLHLQEPNPLIDWAHLPVTIPRQHSGWEVATGDSRIAGISAFGFSGSNVHLIVEEYKEPPQQEGVPAVEQRAAAGPLPVCAQPHVLTISAKDSEALKQLAARYAAFLTAHPDVRLGDVCFTANTARAQLPYRLAFVADSAATLIAALQDAAAGTLREGAWASANLGDMNRPTAHDRATDAWSQLARTYVQGTAALPDLAYGVAPRRVLLPTYPFTHQRFPFQVEGRISVPGRPAALLHPLLGRRLASAGSEILFESLVGPDSPALLADHQVLGKTIFPGAGFLESALKAGQVICGNDAALSAVAIREPLVLTGARTVQLVLRPRDEAATGFEFKICSRAADTEDAWQLHVTGSITAAAQAAAPAVQNSQALRARFSRTQNASDCYESFAARGLQYGPRFRVLQWVALEENSPTGEDATEALGLVRLTDERQASEHGDSYHLHPALLDGCFQLVQVLALQKEPEQSYLPVSIQRVVLHGPVPAAVLVTARLTHVGAAHLKASLSLYAEDGRPVAELVDVIGAPLRADSLSAEAAPDDRFRFALRWEALPGALPAGANVTGAWLILAARGDATAAALAARLEANGATAVIASPHAEYREQSASRFDVPLHEKAAVVRMLTRIAASAGPCRGVVHMLGGADETTLAGGTLALQSALTLVQGLSELSQRTLPRLFLVTRGAVRTEGETMPHLPFAAPLWGLGRTLAVEQPKLKPVCIDLAPAQADAADFLYAELGQTGDENQLAWRQGVRRVPRLVRAPRTRTRTTAAGAEPPVRLTLTEYGSMDYLCLKPQEPMVPQAGEVIVAVGAAGLNFRDVLHALGMLREHAEAMGIKSATAMPFGFECSGTIAAVGAGVSHVKPGDEVISVLASGSLASFTRGRADFVVKKPPQLSHAEAATLATTFITAIYGLEHLARIQPGDKVLIHAAAGGVGLAAVQLVQALGGEVFATASPGKWAMLREMGVRHVMHSRTQDFAAQILEATDDRGVDVVLNSLNGEFIPSSLSVLARGGRFIEIGKLGIWSSAQVAQVRPDVFYQSFDLNEIARARPSLIAELLGEVAARSAAGRIAPLPLHSFALKDSAQAFRFMAQGKHVGKVVITVADEVRSTGTIRPDATYLITGGLGRIGLTLARWLRERGARHLALLGRSEPSATARAALDQLTAQGVQVRVLKADVSSASELDAAFTTIDAELPPLAGVFHAAGVLADTPIGKLSWSRCAEVLGPKVSGSLLLHERTRARSLDHFVLFSSMATVLGNPGQASYAAANTFLDALAHYRAAHDLPAASINWGVWAEGGMRASERQLAAVGATALPTEICLAILDDVLQQRPVQSCVVDLDVSTYAARMGLEAGRGLLSQLLPTGAAPPRAASVPPTLRQALTESPATERRRLLLRHLQKVTAKLLGFAIDQLVVDQPLTTQGLDSLMAVELCTKIGQDLGAELPVSLTFDYPTLAKIADFLLHEVLALQTADENVSPAEAAPASTASVLDEIEALLGRA